MKRPNLLRTVSLAVFVAAWAYSTLTNEQDLRTLAVVGERVALVIAWIGGLL